ncbi:nitrate- and nitrite sensing domain-containing protein [Jannaschia sp. M317]|uniref:nitrate- and nitrite sensing domain-containing protein n=1 Tax=Jannaschia sp. M317 TaxID=2867011 RepID=UPI0021A4BD51|nr:nitrate- and nitrite sensing domain-containing protein [Jannaschia sp. M317]UWQ18993.1 nitrate- and nitrite sensing domain-containing protein [Jannaschia sp. M317]
MMRLRTLTVSQSMAVVFFSGFAVALLFSLSSLMAQKQEHGILSRDRDLLQLTQNMGALVHEMQRERGLTYSWLTARDEDLRDALEVQRLATDTVLSRVMLSNGNEMHRDVMTSGGRFAVLQHWLDTHRETVDAGDLIPRAYRDAMTEQNTRIIGAVARAAESAWSGRLALLMRNASALMVAKDAVGLERAMGGAIIANLAAGRAVPEALRRELQDQQLIRDTWLAGFRMVADEEARVSTDLWARAPETTKFLAARAALLDPTGRDTRLPASPQAWFTIADRLIDSLRTLEVEGNVRLNEALDAETTALWHAFVRDLTFLAGLFMIFGSLAYLTLHRVDQSIGSIIASIHAMSQDPVGTRVPPCSQADLNQISEALSALRAAQIERRMSAAAAEDIRIYVDERLDDVLAAAARGDADRRIDVLGLDAHGAVLARGINRLLDQIESDQSNNRSASA